MKHPSRLQIAWAAGLFEGEGTIYIADKPKRTVRVAITMTDLDVLEEMKLVFGGYLREERVANKKYKAAYRWYLPGKREARKFLLFIIPFLFSRRLKKAKEAVKTANVFIKEEEKRKNKKYKILDYCKTNLCSHRIVATKFGVSRSYVTKIANRNGLYRLSL